MKWIFAAWAIILIVLGLICWMQYKILHQQERHEGKKTEKKDEIWPYFMPWVKQLKLEQRLGKYIQVLQRDHGILFGFQEAVLQTRLFLAKMLGIVWFVHVLLALMAFSAGGDASIFLLLLMFTVLIPVVGVRQIQQQLKVRKQKILMELPKLLNKIALLIGAGETLHRSMIKAAEGEAAQDMSHPLYKEWNRMVQQLRNHYPFQQAMEEFNRRCAVQEVSLFTNTILLHFKRGGEEFATALRGLSQQLWESRKAVAKTMGEEASSMLVFPMVIIFLVVLIITAAPAVMSVQF
ncbi:type II secretion system F family protein [Marinicrinis lubricantis]|uniref:Type II secretion system F family protein n=1 Tax=Marinicrinis lubricantis TaxID=2086470 RepID=A0ABW1ITC3_9BACL